jgi:hypothetical protein
VSLKSFAYFTEFTLLSAGVKLSIAISDLLLLGEDRDKYTSF